MKRCTVCKQKELKDKEFGYLVGYYEFPIKIGNRPIKYLVCTKCNRCFIENNNKLNLRKSNQRIVDIKNLKV